MTSKIRIRVGEIEVEYEGSEDFIKDELPDLIEAVAKLHGSVPGVKETITKPADLKAASMSCTTIAQKLDAKKSPDLMLAAALKLTLDSGGKEFTKTLLRDTMKGATGFYKSSYANNFDKTLARLVGKGSINHSGGENYALPVKEKDALLARVTKDAPAK